MLLRRERGREERRDETRRDGWKTSIAKTPHKPCQTKIFQLKRDHIKFETKLVYFMLLTWCGVRKSKAWAWAIAWVLTVCKLCTFYSWSYTNTHEILAWIRMTINIFFTFISFLIIGAVTFVRLLILFATKSSLFIAAKIYTGTQVNGLEHIQSFVCYYFQKPNKTSSK